MNDTVYSREFYEEQSAGSLASARVILADLHRTAPFTSAVDIGCGVAPWLKVAIELGAEKALGLDGEYVERDHLLVDPDLFQPCDLETGNLLAAAGDRGPFDLAICMEVAEHLSSDRAASFITELCGLSDMVLFSAAIPGQGGTNHINEQWPSYWFPLFDANGFDCFDVLRPRLWEQEQCEWWYLQNALLFAKRDTDAWTKAATLGVRQTTAPMSLIHPRVLPHVVKYAADRIAEEVAKHKPFARPEHVSELEHKVDGLRSSLAGKADEIGQMAQQIERLTLIADARRQNLDQLRQTTEECAERIEGLRLAVQDRAAAVAERDQQIGQMQAALQSAGHEVAALRASTSWRLTAPLRVIGGFGSRR